MERTEFVLDDLVNKYEHVADSLVFTRLYAQSRWQHMFAVLHEKLNDHFHSINGRISSTGHYWADSSRELIALLRDVKDDLYALKRAGVQIEVNPGYQAAIEKCRGWLSPSGGSAFPALVKVLRQLD